VTLIVLVKLPVNTVILQFRGNYVNRIVRILGIVVVVSNVAGFAADIGDQAKWNYWNDKGRVAGPAWKWFMKNCLAGKLKAGHKATAREELMQQCHMDAADRTGDDRKAFLSGCLKGTVN
jgi:hypothetical protein